MWCYNGRGTGVHLQVIHTDQVLIPDSIWLLTVHKRNSVVILCNKSFIHLLNEERRIHRKKENLFPQTEKFVLDFPITHIYGKKIWSNKCLQNACIPTVKSKKRKQKCLFIY